MASIYTKQISSLVGGVSQQPDSIRFDGQAQEQINFYPSESLGLIKRGPTDLLAEVLKIDENAYTFSYERPGIKALMIAEGDGGLRFIRDDGSSGIIQASNSYLSTPNAKRDLTHIMIGDSVLLVNKEKTTQRKTNPIPYEALSKAMVYVVKGDFGKTYRVILKTTNDVYIGSYTTPDGSQAHHSTSLDTDFITSQIATALQADITLGSNDFTVTSRGNVILLSVSDKDFQISTSDGAADTSMYAIKEKAALFSDLPRKAPPGYIVSITGNEGNVSQQPYYVEAVPLGDVQPGFEGWPLVNWTESKPKGTDFELDGETLPVLIKNTGDNPLVFITETIPWGIRSVGDEDSAPFPGFIDKAIKGVFFFKNRLAFYAGQTVVLSESGNFFNFFPTSTATLLDADPIDVSLNSKDASDLSHGIPFQEQVMLSTDGHQYALKSEGSLSLKSISITPTTSFNMDKDLTPVSSGSSLFLASKNGQSTEVREYSVNQIVDVNSASTITSHVPTYIPWKPRAFKASKDGKHVAMLSGGVIYIYKYIWAGDQKVQNAWFKLDMMDEGYTFEHLEFMDDRFYVFMSKDGYTKVLGMELTDSVSAGEVDFQIYLDSREENPTLTLAEEFSTTYTLRGTPTSSLKVIDTSPERLGEEIDIVSMEGNEVTVKGSPTSLVFGYNYTCRYDFSTIFMKGQGQGATAVTSGNTTLLKMLFNYAHSAGFKVEVSIKGRPLRVKEFFARIRGSADNTFGSMAISSGVLKVPINARTDTSRISLVSSNHLPSSVQFVDVVLRYASTTGRQVS